jgi:hypothetical protein
MGFWVSAAAPIGRVAREIARHARGKRDTRPLPVPHADAQEGLFRKLVWFVREKPREFAA